MGEGGILQEEVASEMRVLGAEENLVVAGVMAETNSETKGSFPDDLKLRLDRKEIVLYR